MKIELNMDTAFEVCCASIFIELTVPCTFNLDNIHGVTYWSCDTTANTSETKVNQFYFNI